MRSSARTARVVAGLVGAVLAVGTGVAPASAAGGWSGAPTLTNPGFETTWDGVPGWTVTGDASAVTVAGDAHSGSRRANLWSAAPYTAELRQTVQGLHPGWWTLRVWVRSGSATPGQALDVSRVGLEQCGASWRYQDVPSTEQDDAWVQVAVSAYVTGSSCTVTLRTATTVGGAWAHFDDVTLTPGRVTRPVRAAEPDARIVLHLTDLGAGAQHLQRWLGQARAHGVPFDVIGLSFYPYWHGSLAMLQQGATTLLEAFPGTQLLVVETAYPFTTADDDGYPNVVGPSQVVPGFPATEAGQASWVRAVQNVVAGLPDGRGLGVVYWEGAWTAVPGGGWDPADPSSGNAWENQAVFDFHDRLLAVRWEFRADPGR